MQNSGIAPVMAQGSNGEIFGFQADTDSFHTLIGQVGPSSQLEDPYTPVEDNLYEIVSDQTFTFINFFSNFSGYSFWELGNHTFDGVTGVFDLGNSLIIGQYYLIIDGIVRPVNMDEIGPLGFNVGIPQGDHTISTLYVTKTQDGDILWDSDTIILRIRDTDNFEPYTVKEVDLQFSYEDVHEESQQILHGDAITLTDRNDRNLLLYGLERNFIFKPEIDASIRNEGIPIGTFDEIEDNSTLNLELEVIVNSTGFDELQRYNRWNKSKGFSFLLDANGPQLIDPEDTSPRKVSLRYGNNFMGILTLAPFGIWHAENSISFPDELQCPDFLVPCKPYKIADHELAIGFSIGSYPSRNFNTPDGVVTLDGSFDFTANVRGADFIFLGQETVETTVTEGAGNNQFWIIVVFLSARFILRRKSV